MSKPNNPQAFPVTYETKYVRKGDPGMTLRDYFAIKSLPLFLENDETLKHLAMRCYNMADAMLKVREL